MHKLKKFKKGIIALAAVSVVIIVVFSVGDVFSQGYGRGKRGNGPGYRYHGYRGLNSMKAELGLTEKQVNKIFDIGTKYRNLYFKNRGNYDKISKLRSEHRKEIDNVLTKSQREKFNTRGYGNRRNGRYGRCYNN